MTINLFKPDQDHGRQGTLACFFQSLGEANLRPDFARYDSTQVRVTYPNRPSYRGLGQPEGFESILKSSHRDNLAVIVQKKQEGAKVKCGLTVQNTSMTDWPYREAFDTAYRAYRARTGASVKEVAEALGKSVGTLNSYRRPKDSITPPPEVLVKAANLFGIPVDDLLPDYRSMGSVKADLAGLSEVDIYRITEAARMLSDGAATQEERDLMLAALRERRDLLATMKRVSQRG